MRKRGAINVIDFVKNVETVVERSEISDEPADRVLAGAPQIRSAV
jgi:hypothetical protein